MLFYVDRNIAKISSFYSLRTKGGQYVRLEIKPKNFLTDDSISAQLFFVFEKKKC